MRLVLILLLCSACTPLPGNNLLLTLTEPTPLSEVEVIETVGLIDATLFCNKMLVKYNAYGAMLLNCIGNGCMVFGCAEIFLNKANTKVAKCDVYLAWDLNILREHEMRHCMGYSDVLY
jgi:hypothetical protein